jgi:hypothetical protein
MAKRDVLDEKMAQQFAWRITKPSDITGADTASPPESAAPEEPEEDAEAEAANAAEQERRAQMAEDRAELAKHTARAWQITSPVLQAKETAELLRRVHGLSLYIAGMGDHPREAILLWRLIVRHHADLTDSESSDAVHALSFMPIDTTLREIVDLLVEVAETGSSWLAFMMEIGEVATETAARRHPELARRLERILTDESKSWESREIAARWLSLSEAREVASLFRRALVLPHAGIRTIALKALLDMEPPAVAEADVLWLLEDAVKHPLAVGPGGMSFETVYDYTNVLVEAVTKVPPPGGFRPLESILDGDCAYPVKNRRGLDDAWALRALAAGYPERALARIDRLLYGSKSWRRHDAVEASGLLPDDLARPRLIEAASRPGHLASEQAKSLWWKRFGEPCPVTELAGVDTEILAGPPSDRFLSCLTVLRGSSDEAKVTMLKALAAEVKAAEVPEGAAPPEELSASEREALALMLFAQSDFMPGRAGLPSSEEAWARMLLRRFGEPAFVGLLKLAERGGRAGVDHEWLSALSDLARKGELSASQRDELRGVAREALSSPGWDGATAPLIALLNVGAPGDLVDRLWSIAMTEMPTSRRPRSLFHFAIHWASDVLCKMDSAPTLDARIAEEGAEAFRARDYVRFERIMVIGIRRRVPLLIELAAQCIDRVDEDRAALDAASRCGYSLAEAGLIDDAWLLALLGRPESLKFKLGTHLVRGRGSDELIAALEGAVESKARGGAAAAEAVESLVAMDVMDRADARLEAILDSAPPRERASLVGLLLRMDAPLAGLRRHLMDLLVGSDAEAASEVLEDLYMRRKEAEGVEDVLEAALTHSIAPSLRRGIERILDKPGEADAYFQDALDEDETEVAGTSNDDDEDDDEDDDDENKAESEGRDESA